MKKNNSVCNYDFTLWNKDKKLDPDEIKVQLRSIAKKWTFQGEDAGSGLHFQGRMSLKVKKRISEISFFGAHLSPTSTANMGNDWYVCKEETRVSGPWRDDDMYVPRQVREIEALYIWQEKILKDVDKWDTRTINILLDKKGNLGKSTLVAYGCCKYPNKVRVLPAIKNYKELMGAVMCMPTARLYICDMPRGLSKTETSEFFAGIESIKNGYVCDTRYSFKEKWFDCPNIWVFTNYIPDRSYLSCDRWRYWEIVANDLRALTL